MGVLLICGGLFSFLPILGLWMLPLGLGLLADDVPRPRYPFCGRFLARARAAPRPADSIGGAGAELWGLFGASRSKPLAEGGCDNLRQKLQHASR